MLTKEQIREIYGFVKSKYVKYYDLQIELVHQMAKKIEYHLEQDPKMDFQNALQKAYSSYGILGFSKVITKQESLISRQSMHMWIHEFSRWFTLPKGLNVAFLFILLWLICGVIPVSFIVIAFMILCLVVGVTQFLKGRVSVLHNRAPLLMLVPFRISLFQAGYFIGCVPLYAFLFAVDFNLSKNISPWVAAHVWIVALWITISLLFILSHLAVYERVLSQAKEKYPGFFKG